MRILPDSNIDFLRWRWHALALSVAVIVGGFAMMAARGGLPLGIDFSGGTVVVVQFDRPVTEEAVRDALEPIEGEKVVQQYGEPGANQVLIRLPEVSAEEEGASLEQDSLRVVEAVRAAGLGEFEVISTEIVGAVIGEDLQWKGIYAAIFSLFGILAYIALRFRPSFGVGAVIATVHDLLVTLSFLMFFGYELSLNVVAAVLTITGYSVNDTIVIFDRVRENLRSMRRDSLHDVVNRSVNQTLSRTIITAFTTTMAVLALYVWGGEVLRGFAFTMLVGLISGTYSTVFIAAAVAILFSRRKAAARAESAASPAAAVPSRRKAARKSKARAS